jgi:predicted nucleic acid-binding protein
LIVVDANVVAYLVLGGVQASAAEDVLLADNEWHAPLLWRSELRSIVTGFLRRGALSQGRSIEIVAAAEVLFFQREHLVPSPHVLRLVAGSRCSAYDCEYVAVAEQLEVPLVTEDKEVLAAFPEVARSMQAFLAGDAA